MNANEKTLRSCFLAGVPAKLRSTATMGWKPMPRGDHSRYVLMKLICSLAFCTRVPSGKFCT
jgi:hypothetical protein